MGANNADFFSGRVTHLTAKEIMGRVFYGDGHTQPKSGMDALEMKYENTDRPGYGASLKKSITESGYDDSKPVHILLHDDDGTPNPQVIEGHHRVAIMYKHNPDQPIPVKFWKNYDEAASAFEKGNVPGVD